jgi:hypothetical protein
VEQADLVRQQIERELRNPKQLIFVAAPRRSRFGNTLILQSRACKQAATSGFRFT